MSFRPAMRIVSLLVLMAVVCPVAAGDEDGAQPIVTVAVKPFDRDTPATEPPDAAPIMSMAPTPPPATLPAERLPQYRIGYQRADATLQSQVNDGTLRFLLTDPAIREQVGRPLLLEATILIDGQPFSSVREQMAATLLTASTEPAIPAEEPVSPATEPVYRLTSDSEELMRRYAEAVGESLDAAEAGWLMTHWTDGPTLLVLHPYYQSFRADQRPVFTVLDKDRDGVLSKTELDQANQSFERCDANRDDIVDVLEIAKAAEALRDPSEASDVREPLFWLLSDLAGVSEQDSHLYRAIAVFDGNQNGQIEAAEIDTLAAQTPDIRMTVTFISESTALSKLHVTDVNQEQNVSTQNISARADRLGHGVDVSIGGLTIHLSAIQATRMQGHSGQIAIGAVVDGYPLLPELDPNDDGRFSIRERRTLTERLHARDRNDDQLLSGQECLSPIRVCIGFGPIVHQELADVRAVPSTAVTEMINGPEWFVRMDRNQDNDLTRGEFPGTDEQFAALDTDGDLLVDASEANNSEKQSDK